MTEEWKSIIVDGKEHKWYSISNYGNILYHMRYRRDLKGRTIPSIYDPSYSRKLIIKSTMDRFGNPKEVRPTFYFPKNFFENYDYASPKGTSSSKCCRRLSIHQIVMETFKPIDKYPPEKLKDCWDDIPEIARYWIKESIVINHIDHDPTNNHVDNLEYTTQRGNAHAAIKFYGGNHNNKHKNKKNVNQEINILTFLQ